MKEAKSPAEKQRGETGLETEAYAKLNLTLDVLGRRDDGYHEMKMVMQAISLSDHIKIRSRTEGLWVLCNTRFAPQGEKNLAGRAVRAFYRALDREAPGMEIVLDKKIPVGAGMAGGSADAAAVLKALNEMEGNPLTWEQLLAAGAEVGSDVPFCIQGGTALAEGRGEVLTPLPALPKCWIVVCKPDFSVPTPELFARLDKNRIRRRPETQGVLDALQTGDLAGVARRMYNVFEDILPPWYNRRVVSIRRELIESGALGACMTGTGSAVFGIFSQEQMARSTRTRLKKEYRDTFLATPV